MKKITIKEWCHDENVYMPLYDVVSKHIIANKYTIIDIYRRMHWAIKGVPTQAEYDEIMHKYYEEECNPWLK